MSQTEKQYQWNLQDIFQNKEAFFKAKQELENLFQEMEKYSGILVESSENLYQCYAIYEKAIELFEKIYAYGMLSYHLDMGNQEGIRLFKEVEQLGTTFTTKTAFMTPEITYAEEGVIERYLKEDKKLKPYVRVIKDILEKKKHVLNQEMENLLARYTETFSAPENTFDILTNAEFKLGTFQNEEGQEIELTDATYSNYLKSKDIKVRKDVFALMYQKYHEFMNTIAELYRANVKTKSITAKVKNYQSTLEKAVLHDDASLNVYDALMQAVDENIEANYEFLQLKKKMLGLPEMHFYDLYVNPCEVEKDQISFEEAKQEVLEALSILGENYLNQLQTAFEKRWLDVYEKENKRSGAYSMGVYGIHPFVLINFTNSKRDVSTIAHELGHAMHSYYANQTQNVIDADYTIMVAEVASTVNELLLSDYQIKKETDPKKKAELLYELLEMIRATFFRQAMFAEFEKEVHEKIERGEILSSEDFNQIYFQLNEKYFGKEVVMDKEIQYEWARIPHFYSDFYVYKYATGVSAAIHIATRILHKEAGFVEKYIQMLKQGCSKKSIDLLKMVDVDLENKETYQATIDFYREKRRELEDILNQ